jgi:hypothetical protein
MEGVLTKARGVLEEVGQERVKGLAEIAEERAKSLAEGAEVRAKGLADIDVRRREFMREVEAMRTHQEKQEGHVELNIGGYRFQTSVQTLRRVPQTFFDAYFSGRYAQDVCDDGSIFVDRDGEHFGHVLECMRDGVVLFAEEGARPSVSLLRLLKREFGFHCMEPNVEKAAEPEKSEVIGGGSFSEVCGMERYDASSGQWSTLSAMGTARREFGACWMAGELYVTGGSTDGRRASTSVEKYSPSSGTWSAVAAMPSVRANHAAVAVGSDMYVLGGYEDIGTHSVFKFDSTHGVWSKMEACMPLWRLNFASCAVGSDIHVFGESGGGSGQSSVFKFDTVAEEWTILAPMPQEATYHSASVMDGLVYIVEVGYRGCVLRFDPALQIWSTLASTSCSRHGGVLFVVGGHLYAAGGADTRSHPPRTSVASKKWRAVADMLEARLGFATVTNGSASPAEEQDLFDSLIAKATERDL